MHSSFNLRIPLLALFKAFAFVSGLRLKRGKIKTAYTAAVQIVIYFIQPTEIATIIKNKKRRDI